MANQNGLMQCTYILMQLKNGVYKWSFKMHMKNGKSKWSIAMYILMKLENGV